MKPKTYHDGANEERSVILAKVRRLTKALKGPGKGVFALVEFEEWLLQRNERYKAKPGGL